MLSLQEAGGRDRKRSRPFGVCRQGAQRKREFAHDRGQEPEAPSAGGTCHMGAGRAGPRSGSLGEGRAGAPAVSHRRNDGREPSGQTRRCAPQTKGAERKVGRKRQMPQVDCRQSQRTIRNYRDRRSVNYSPKDDGLLLPPSLQAEDLQNWRPSHARHHAEPEHTLALLSALPGGGLSLLWKQTRS